MFATPLDILIFTIEMLNAYRAAYLESKDKSDWWQMIQLLPSSYNQKRTVMLSYEVLANIYKSRRHHKLDEWHTFCDWIDGLPYSELITGIPIQDELLNPQVGNVLSVNDAKKMFGLTPEDEK